MTILHSRYMWITLGALAAAGIIIAVILQKKQGMDSASTAQTGISASPASSAPPIPPAPDATQFAHLPPAERINAETKARMARNAAIREKLRQGNYSTLPPEALPAATSPPLSAPAASP